MAIFKNAEGKQLDTSKYTNLQDQQAIDWAKGQDLFKGYSLVEQKPAPVNTINAQALTNDQEADKVIAENQKINQQNTIPYYGQERVKDLKIEQNALSDLGNFLNKKTVGGKTLYSTVSQENLPKYVNAYLYGGYSMDDIANDLYARATGKAGIIHPTISRSQWIKPEASNLGKNGTVANDNGQSGVTEHEKPKTVAETLDEMLKNITFDRTKANQEAGIPEKQTEVAKLKAELDAMKNEMGLNSVLQTTNIAKMKNEYYDEKDKIEDQVIPMSAINAQLGKLTDTTNIALDKESLAQAVADATNTYKYNSKLIEYNIASTNLANAQALVQQTAQDFKDFNTQKLNLLQFQNTITQQDKDLLQKEIDREYEMATAGYTYIQSPSALQELAKQKGLEWVKANTINIAGKVYIKPQDVSKAPNVQVLGESANGQKIYGYWDEKTQSFKQTSNFQNDQSQADFNLTNFAQSFGGIITQNFDTPVSYFADGRTTHSGYDIAGKMNQDVQSPISGTIIEAQSSEGWGNTIVIQDAQGNNWRLAHFNSFASGIAKVGTKISAGQVLGKLGNTGYVMKGDGTKPTSAELKNGAGTHLHLEIKDKNGNLIDVTKQGNKFTTEFYATDYGQKVLNNEQQYNTNFLSQQTIKDYLVVQNKAESVKRIFEAGVGGPGDLAMVYEFMKALDPSSVVREAEYDSAAKSGNLFKGWAAKFNGYLKEEGGILPDNVKQSFITIVKQKLDVYQTQYDKLRDHYRKIAQEQDLNPEHVAPDMTINWKAFSDNLTDEEAYQEYLRIKNQQ